MRPSELTAHFRGLVLAPDPPSTLFERFERRFMDGKNWDVPQRLQWPSYFSTNREIGNGLRADWQNVDWRIYEWSTIFLSLARDQQIPLFVHCAYRTEAEQRDAVKRGVSRAVWPNAAHCQGAAVDIVHARYAWDLTRREWQYVAVLGRRALDRLNGSARGSQRLELVWGGDWQSLYDPAHWEVADWRERIREPVEGDPVRKGQYSVAGAYRHSTGYIGR